VNYQASSAIPIALVHSTSMEPNSSEEHFKLKEKRRVGDRTAYWKTFEAVTVIFLYEDTMIT
jgi:hypothetical protein